jgi:uncharacterized protein YgiM (DUF1202 family)
MEKMASIIKDYITSYPDPLKLKKGEEVVITPKESEWAGWVWCTTMQNKSGWAPEGCLSITGHVGILLRDYDAIELNVGKGDKVVILYEESGWGWCKKVTGECGWVPLENMKYSS